MFLFTTERLAKYDKYAIAIQTNSRRKTILA